MFIKYKLKRIKNKFTDLLSVIEPKYIDDLLNGNIKRDSIIETKCPLCDKYAPHKFHNIYSLSKDTFKYGTAPVCNKCKMSQISKTEVEISDYILTFYTGTCIRNSRDIIKPLELDLYYPEKRIAIEFNGDYWHSNKFKDDKYHYNKFKLCYDNNIILVNIFESEWNNKKKK